MHHPTLRACWPSRIAALAIAFLTLRGSAAELVSLQVLTENIVMLQFEDGTVHYHKRGEPRTADQVNVNPLAVKAASQPASYGIESPDDPHYSASRVPVEIARKSKGTQFAWQVDSMVNGQVQNTTPDHSSTHWLYLHLPTSLQEGKHYTIHTTSLATNGKDWPLFFNSRQSRSEAIHVNTIGYRRDAPEKYGYLYYWEGDHGSLNLNAYQSRLFRLVEQATGKTVFTGHIKFRSRKENPETTQISDSPPWGNFLNANVWECDFSAFQTPGRFVLSVDGLGCSWPFQIAADIYREPFRQVARALYHNRSGIALTKPYTEFERPAPHNPRLTPGFAGKLFYTTVRFTEWGSDGGDAKTLKAGEKGTLDSSGWYQDAGDWDSYYTHLRVAQELLFAYELAPDNFTDGELNIPESGNGLPDILDEASWLPRFCFRLRHELLEKRYGTGGIGLRIAGDAFGPDEKVLPDGRRVGQGSWEDVNRQWAVSGEDPWSTYRYAGAAAHLAYALELCGRKDPEGVNWLKEAQEAYAWSKSNTRPDDDSNLLPLADPRSYAAAALFRLTGDRAYEKQFLADSSEVAADSFLTGERRYGLWVYALTSRSAGGDAAAKLRISRAILHTADIMLVRTAAQRALRWGGDPGMPMLIGQQTTPMIFDGVVAYSLISETDPIRSRAYLSALLTTCDYFLGTNALNQTWITGVGPRSPTQIFHMDAWYNGKDRFQPGLTPYGPWRKEKNLGAGPWDQDWPNNTVYPALEQWPGNERWFNNRCSPMNSEFTIHQQTAPEAALFGFLCAPRTKPSAPTP